MSDTTPSDQPTDQPVDAPITDEVAAPAVCGEAAVDPVTAPPVTQAPATPAFTPVTPEETGYSVGGVPTFDYVREKIETRFGTSIGAAELAAETPEGRSIDEQYEARQQAAADRLAQIRESMKKEDS